MTRRYRIGMDIGGTFTDFVLLDTLNDAVALHKRLTTPSDPAEGALAGITELLEAHSIEMGNVDAILHGTTLVSNAIIERGGRPTALLTTKGFRDVLEMGHEQRYDIYDLFLQFPEPVVPRRHRIEIDERVTRDGEVLQTPDTAATLAKIPALLADGIEAIAVCFLHSYLNPANERAVLEALSGKYPELHLCASHEVAPEIREYERTNTTVCNAYVQPLMHRYLRNIEDALELAGFRGRFALMLSSGGTASPDTARRFPVRLLESGPAGGALATAYLGKRAGLRNLLAFDMGGTTAKACLIQNGRPDIAPQMEAGRVHRFKKGSGLPIRSPVVDMIEVGAGGGSIAQRDTLGLLKVGPHSAGADPGPAAYGRGGDAPTVTDACLLLGYYDPAFFLGGSMPLDIGAAQSAFERLGGELGLDVARTAWGVHHVVCENMARAARIHIIEKGRDPRRFPVLAFGGAGPAHAARVARILGANQVLVPPVSGVAAALGLLVAPTSFEFVRSSPALIDDVEWSAANDIFTKFESDATHLLTRSGVDPQAIVFERSADARLLGQFHEIEIAVPAGVLSPEMAPGLKDTFSRVYGARYHTVLEGYRPMVMNWRLRAYGPEPQVALKPQFSGDAKQARKGIRRAFFPEADGYVDTPVYDRYALPRHLIIEGPAIVEERESTTVIAPGDRLHADESGNLSIEIAAQPADLPSPEVSR